MHVDNLESRFRPINRRGFKIRNKSHQIFVCTALYIRHNVCMKGWTKDDKKKIPDLVIDVGDTKFSIEFKSRPLSKESVEELHGLIRENARLLEAEEDNAPAR